MEDTTRQDVLKRLNYIEGHLGGVRRMIEEDKCGAPSRRWRR
jgi:DNA-binding FrmR family transcriptional regulator